LRTADIKAMSVEQFQELVNQMKKKRVVEQWKRIATLIQKIKLQVNGLGYF
jgi:ribosomal protein L7/L12